MDWEQLGQRIADVGKDVGDKVKETADMVRLKQKLAAEERKQKEAYAAIGKLYYETHEGEIAEDFIPWFEKVGEAGAAIADYQEQINQAKKQVRCPECGEYQNVDAAFCNKCGAKLK